MKIGNLRAVIHCKYRSNHCIYSTEMWSTAETSKQSSAGGPPTELPRRDVRANLFSTTTEIDTDERKSV